MNLHTIEHAWQTTKQELETYLIRYGREESDVLYDEAKDLHYFFRDNGGFERLTKHYLPAKFNKLGL